MTNGGDVDDPLRIVDLVEYAPVADANAPTVARTAKLLRSVRPRLGRQSLDLCAHTFDDSTRQVLQLFARGARDRELLLRHAAYRP